MAFFLIFYIIHYVQLYDESVLGIRINPKKIFGNLSTGLSVHGYRLSSRYGRLLVVVLQACRGVLQRLQISAVVTKLFKGSAVSITIILFTCCVKKLYKTCLCIKINLKTNYTFGNLFRSLSVYESPIQSSYHKHVRMTPRRRIARMRGWPSRLLLKHRGP